MQDKWFLAPLKAEERICTAFQYEKALVTVQT